MAEHDGPQAHRQAHQPASPAGPEQTLSESPLTTNPLLVQQRTIGNQAVQRMIRSGTLPAGTILGQQQTLGNQAVQRLLMSTAVRSAPALQVEGTAPVAQPDKQADPTPAPPALQRAGEQEQPSLSTAPSGQTIIQRTRKRKAQDDSNSQPSQLRPVPDDFNDKLRDLKIWIDETTDVPQVTYQGRQDASPAMPKPHSGWNLPVEQKYIRDRYTIPFRTYDEDGSGSGGRAYKLEIPYHVIIDGRYSARAIQIATHAEIAAEGNPFDRFGMQDAFILVTDPNLDMAPLSQKIGDDKVSDDPSDIPPGYQLDHTSGLGYQVYTSTGGAGAHALPATATADAQDPNKVQVDTNVSARTLGGVAGKANRLTLNKWRGRMRWPDQATVMNQSPNDVAQAINLPDDDWEWLHLIAHRFGGGNNHPQVPSNLVLGTEYANSRMMEIEDAIAVVLKQPGVTGTNFTVTPILVDPNVPWLATQIDYQVTVQKQNGPPKDLHETFNPLSNVQPPFAGLQAAREFAKQV